MHVDITSIPLRNHVDFSEMFTEFQNRAILRLPLESERERHRQCWTKRLGPNLTLQPGARAALHARMTRNDFPVGLTAPILRN